MTLLAVEQLRAGYGDAVAIDEVSFAIQDGGSLALLGRNGVGKTSLIATLMGHTRLMGGTIVCATAVPDSVSPSASPRPALKTLDTAADHTVDLIITAGKA